MRRILKRLFSSFGLDLRKRTPTSEFLGLMGELWPKSIGVDLIRVGGSQDGAYLLPNMITGDEVCISPGVGDSIFFEKDLHNKFGINSILLDNSVDKPKDLPDTSVFIKKHLGSFDSVGSVTLKTLIEKYAPKSECIVQMDIEGAEYLILPSLDEVAKNKIKILVIEFHNIHYWTTYIYFENIVKPALKFLLQDFCVVHLKPNNADTTFSFAGYSFPNTLEVTLVSRRFVEPQKSVDRLPHPLDVKNNPNKDFLNFPKVYF